jgi:hypothetical protein
MYTYTVRPMYRYYRETISGLSALSRSPEGYKTVVRDGDKVVHQFPRMERADLCHKLAQRHILSLKAADEAAALLQKVMA